MPKYKDIDINPVDDHSEKWNVETSELEKANQRMAAISNLPKISVEDVEEVKEPVYIMKEYAGETIKITPKTSAEYDHLWNLFVEEYEPEFKKYMGYGKKTIKKLGYKDFIDFMGWDNEYHIAQWKNNILHVIPCVHCKQHFTTVEQNYGLCPRCSKEYDMSRFIEMLTANEKSNPGSINAIRAMFLYDAGFRNRYKIKSDNERFNDCIAENFEGFDTYRYIKDSLIKEEGDANLVLERMLAPLMGRKDYERIEEKLEEVFTDLLEADNIDEQVKILQDIFLKEDEEAED